MTDRRKRTGRIVGAALALLVALWGVLSLVSDPASEVPPTDQEESARASEEGVETPEPFLQLVEVAGRVEDQAGAPLHPVSIEVEVWEGQTRAGVIGSGRTAPEGGYRIPLDVRIQRSQTVRVVARTPGDGLVERRFPGSELPRDGRLICDLQGTSLASVFGRIVDQDGTPVRRAWVYVLLPEEVIARAEGGFAYTDDDGLYEVPTPSLGVRDIGANARGFLPVVRKDVAIEAGKRTRIDFVLERGLEISGIVTDERGEPVPGYQVIAERTGVPASGARGFEIGWGRKHLFDVIFETLTGARGEFVLRGLSPGRYRLLATSFKIDYENPEEATDARAGDKGVRIVIRRSTLLRGRLTGAASGEPLAFGFAKLLSGDEVVAVAEFHRQGEFVARVPPGKPLTLQIGARSYEERELEELQLESAEHRDLGDLELQPVTDETMATLTVLLEDLPDGSKPMVLAYSRKGGSYVGPYDEEDGAARLVLPLGDYRLTVAPGGYCIPTASEVSVGSPEKLIRVKCQVGGRVEINVPVDAGRNPGLLSVRLIDTATQRNRRFTRFASMAGGVSQQTENQIRVPGKSLSEPLPPGTYRLETVGERGALSAEFRIEAGKTATATLKER